MTKCFFSLSNSAKFEEELLSEVFGCFKHIGIPIETVYNLPIQQRRYFIRLHNKMANEEKDKDDLTKSDINEEQIREIQSFSEMSNFKVKE